VNAFTLFEAKLTPSPILVSLKLRNTFFFMELLKLQLDVIPKKPAMLYP
jgi:hypothetical protein